MSCKPFHPNVEVLRLLHIPPEILQIIHKYYMVLILQTLFYNAIENHKQVITFSEYLLLHNSSGIGLGIQFNMQNDQTQSHMDFIFSKIVESRNMRNSLLKKWANFLKSCLPSGSFHGNKSLWGLQPFVGNNITPEIFETIFKVLKYELKIDFGDYQPFGLFFV